MEDDFNISVLLGMLDVPGGQLPSNYSWEDFYRVSIEYKEDSHWFDTPTEAGIIAGFVILALIGLVGNGLVFYIIFRKGWKQSSRNWYIMNLAGTDILTCVACKPLTIVRLVLKNWTLGSALCKAVPFLQTTYVFVSTFTLVALAVDRYGAIIYNNRHAQYKNFVYVCLILIWLFSLAISVPMVVVHDVRVVKEFGEVVIYSICLEQWSSNVSATTYTVLLLLLQYLSPLVAIVTLHLLIGRFLRLRVRSASPIDPNMRRKRRRHRKNILLLSSMAITFGVAWFPLHFVNSLATIEYSIFDDANFPLLHALCMMVAFSSVCINPLIYGFLNTNFRRDLIKICRNQTPRFSIYTDFTRRSSHPEHLGLITTAPLEGGLSTTNVSRMRDNVSIV